MKQGTGEVQQDADPVIEPLFGEAQSPVSHMTRLFWQGIGAQQHCSFEKRLSTKIKLIKDRYEKRRQLHRCD